MNSYLPLLGDKQLLSFLCLRTSKTSSLGVFDECKTHLCFEFISHAILCILYPYSCKTYKISSKTWFCRIIDEKQVIWQEMSNLFPKEESTKSLIAHH